MPRVLAATDDAVAEAAALLRAGSLVAFPTETVYGLGADATDAAAVAAVFAAKGRPSFNPLIVHVPDVAAARAWAEMSPQAERLAEAFWPGPLTLVLRKRAGAPLAAAVTAGLPSVALRAPAHPVAQALLRAAGVPLAAPSANPSGRLSPTTAAHVAEGLGDRIALILDGGPCAVGVESTVAAVDPDGVTLLRPGAIAAAQLAAIAGPLRRAPENPELPRSPGQLASHYAPRKPLRLNATHAEADEVLIAFGPHAPAGAAFNLSLRGDLAEAAANLFAILHEADARPGAAIAVMPVPEEGVGVAVNDRLRRAAAPRVGA